MPKVRIDEQAEPDELPPGPADSAVILRGGFTTGTAAVAAAMAATIILTGKTPPSAIAVRLPGGDDLSVSVAQASIVNADEAMAVVVKDGGDDPDVTNRAEIGAIVRRRPEPGLIHIIGGRGVGRVTRPGLVLPPGQWAVNPGPRAMLQENLAPFLCPGTLPGLEVEIFVEKGEELATRTLNPRLGIVGGISILGTTGLVKPFSNEAYVATIESALNVAKAAGLKEVVLTTGRRSEKLAMNRRPDLPPESFIQVADFYGAALEMAAERFFSVIGLAAFFGKAVKQAAGHFNTHAHRNDQDTASLAGWLSPPFDEELTSEIGRNLTARGALETIRQRGAARAAEWAAGLVAEKALISARNFVGSGPDLWMVIFDYDDQPLAESSAADSGRGAS